MESLEGRYWLTLTVVFLLISSAKSCNQRCIESFNNALSQAGTIAHQTGNSSLGLETSCQALLNHIECLEGIKETCDNTMLQIVQSTIESTNTTYGRSCRPQIARGMGADAVNCGELYMLCNEQFNSTFTPAMNAYDIPKACPTISNYTVCIEQLLSNPECFQFANHAINAVQNIKSRYVGLCPNAGNPGGPMDVCMNRTMECYFAFNNTYYPSMRESNMTLMCSSLSNYSSCIQAVSGEAICQPYTGQALSSIQVLQREHQTACGTDGGRKSTECFMKFRECYQHFNDTFNPAVQRMDIHKLCESMDEYKTCSQTIPTDCDIYLGQSIDGLNRMQAQYSQYCTQENKKIFSCSQLSRCNRNLIGNLTMTGAESGMLCIVLESYFPCVDAAVQECMLSGDGVTAISFRDLGAISSRYCRSVLTNPSIKSCMSFMQCHAALDLNNISPAMMVEGTYWCHYMESSLMCSSRLISAGQCAVQNRQDMLSNIVSLQQRTNFTCTTTTPLPAAVTTTEMTTMEPETDKPADPDTPAVTPAVKPGDKTDKKDKTDKVDDSKDKTRPGTRGVTDNQSGKPGDAAASLTFNIMTLTLSFIAVNLFQRHL